MYRVEFMDSFITSLMKNLFNPKQDCVDLLLYSRYYHGINNNLFANKSIVVHATVEEEVTSPLNFTLFQRRPGI